MYEVVRVEFRCADTVWQRINEEEIPIIKYNKEEHGELRMLVHRDDVKRIEEIYREEHEKIWYSKP